MFNKTYFGVGEDITKGCDYCTQCKIVDVDSVHMLKICKCNRGNHPEGCIYCLSHLKEKGYKELMQEVKEQYLKDARDEEFYRNPSEEDLKYFNGNLSKRQELKNEISKIIDELNELYEKERTGCINVTVNVNNAMTNYLLQQPVVDFEVLKKTIHQQIDEICDTEHLYGFSYSVKTTWDDVPHVDYSISKYVVPKQLEKRIYKEDT